MRSNYQIVKRVKQIVSKAETGEGNNAETPQSKEKKSKLKKSIEKKDRVKHISSYPKKYFSDEDIEMVLSKDLFNRMRLNNEKCREPNLQNWAKSIDAMIRIDGRSVDDIRLLIIFCQSDEFWKSNILSTSKLRQAFDQLILKERRKSSINTDQDWKGW